MDFKPFYEPYDDVELMALKARLDDAGIRYTVHGEFTSAAIGMSIRDYSTRMVMVWEEDFERAKKVLEQFLAGKASHRKPRRRGPLDKILMSAVTFLSVIFFPTSLKTFLARRRNRKRREKEQQEQHENSRT